MTGPSYLVNQLVTGASSLATCFTVLALSFSWILLYFIGRSKRTCSSTKLQMKTPSALSSWRGLTQRFKVMNGDSYAAASELARIADMMPSVFVLPCAFHRNRIVATSQEALRAVAEMEASGVIEKPPHVMLFLRAIFGSYSVITSTAKEHRDRRCITTSAMREGCSVSRVAGIFFRSGNALAGRLSEGNFEDAHEEAMNATLGVISETIFGAEVPERARIHEIYVKLLVREYPSNLSIFVRIVRLMMLGMEEDNNNLTMELNSTFERLIHQRRQQRLEEPKDESVSGSPFLDMLLTALDTGEIDERELHSALQTFYVAGFTTTAVWLSWSLYYLADKTEWQDSLREELKSVQDIESEPERLQALDALPRLQAFTKEVLRLCPPIPDTLRSNIDDIVLDGYLVPKRSLIRIPISSIHRMERYWGPTADQFDPNRHLHGDKSLTSHWVPFSRGSHSCLGAHFARYEVKAAVAQIVTRLTLSKPRIGACGNGLGSPSRFSLRASIIGS